MTFHPQHAARRRLRHRHGCPLGLRDGANHPAVFPVDVRVGDAPGDRPTAFDDPHLPRPRIGVHVIGDDYASVLPAQALALRGMVQSMAVRRGDAALERALDGVIALCAQEIRAMLERCHVPLLAPGRAPHVP